MALAVGRWTTPKSSSRKFWSLRGVSLDTVQWWSGKRMRTNRWLLTQRVIRYRRVQNESVVSQNEVGSMASQYTRIQIGADRAYSAHQVASCINFVSQVGCIDFVWTRSGLDEIWTINCSLILNTVQTVRFYSFRIYLKNLTKYKVHKKIPAFFLSFQCETFLLVKGYLYIHIYYTYIYIYMCKEYIWK